MYTVCLEGIDRGRKVQNRRIIDVLRDFINPFEEYEKYLAYARRKELIIECRRNKIIYKKIL